MKYLMHHGVPGQKRGIRRYQNPDGSLTPEGREHYGIKEREKSLKYIDKMYKKSVKKHKKAYLKYRNTVAKNASEPKRLKAFKKYAKRIEKIDKKYQNKIGKKAYSYINQYNKIDMTNISSAENVRHIGEALTNYMVDYVKANGGH